METLYRGIKYYDKDLFLNDLATYKSKVLEN
jgi:hypothetical protein